MSTITIYRDCEIVENKNFAVDDIESYLSTLTKVVKNDFQYVKILKETKIKVNFSAYSVLNTYQSTKWNYVKIVNNEEQSNATTYYFFITNKRWRADSTIELSLKMDTLNTFSEDNGKITFNKRTRILREHRDRFTNFLGSIFKRTIDPISEGITPRLVKKNLEDSKITPYGNLDWYLIYANQNNPSESLINPVRCFTCASEKLNVNTGKSSLIMTPSDFQAGVQYYISSQTTPNFSATINDITYNFTSSNQIYMISSNGNTISFRNLNYDSNGEMQNWGSVSLLNISEIKFNLIDKLYKYTNTSVSFTANSFYLLSESNNFIELNANESSILINSINDIDRTDPKLIKIIKLPYPPLKFNYDTINLSIEVGEEWSFGNEYNILELKDLSTKFDYEFVSLQSNPFSSLLVNIENTNSLIDKNILFESKLYHSDFYQPKFFYDSFGFTFNLEKAYYPEDSFSIGYLVASTINSRFMFYFPQYEREKDVSQDYDKYMIITRNNDEVLYNSPYINYIRNGFNYDVKAKNLAYASSIGSLGVSALGTLIGVATSNPIITTTSLIGLAGNLYQTINNIAQQENTFEAKQNNLKNQATSVATNDDIDLMSKYSENKLKYNIYEPTEQMKKAIFDLFYYTGYKTDYCGIPNLKTRKLFNFLQCDLVLENYANMDDDMLEDLTTKYNNGITILHNFNEHWEFDQVHENWETNI